MQRERLSKSLKIKTFELQNLIDKKDLESIITNFSTVTGLGSGIVKMKAEYEQFGGIDTHLIEKRFAKLDLSKERLTVVAGSSKFCKFIRLSKRGDLRCWWSDLRYCNEAFQKGHPVLYRCHCGLIDIVAPIRLGSWHVANVYVGQILSDLTDAELKKYFSNYLTMYLPLERKLNPDLSRKEFEKIVSELELFQADETLTFEQFKALISELPKKGQKQYR